MIVFKRECMTAVTLKISACYCYFEIIKMFLNIPTLFNLITKIG